MKLTNVHKHFGLMLLLGILAWVIAYSGTESSGLFYPSTKFTKLDFDTGAEMQQYITDNNLDIMEVEDDN